MRSMIATTEQAGFVQMNMRINEAWQSQSSFGVQLAGISLDARLDSDQPTTANA